MIIDSHCHLNFNEIKNDIDNIIRRAVDSGVCLMQSVCTSMHEFEDIKAISERFKEVYCSVGVHPLNIAENNGVTYKDIVDKCSLDKVIGIGETGLDFFKSKDVSQQMHMFEQHIIASQETGLPIIIHSRNAESETIEILRKNLSRKKFTGVMHCFTGSLEFALECIDLGFYISASGVVTFKKADAIRDVFKNIPLSRVLIETDAPFLAPIPNRGKDNEPSYLKYTAEFLSTFLNINYEEFSQITTSNFAKLFNVAP